jgi:chromosome segregation ATPase
VAAVVASIILIGAFMLVDTSAQKRKKRRRSRPAAPRITNPEIYQVPPAENSNANSATDPPDSSTNSNTNSTPVEDPESMKKTIRDLSNQVDKLTDKLSQMEESQRSLVDLERLSRAEQRSAQLRNELRDVQAKKGDLEAHLEEVEFAVKPENIERSTAGYGTTRPEEARAQRRKYLENDRERTRRQIEQLAASETRLQQAIATSDLEVERWQKKLEVADRVAVENQKVKSQAEEAQPLPSPTPSPGPLR